MEDLIEEKEEKDLMEEMELGDIQAQILLSSLFGSLSCRINMTHSFYVFVFVCYVCNVGFSICCDV